MKKKNQLTHNEKEVLLLKGKIQFLKSKNNFLKSDIIIKQKVKDLILENNSNLLNNQCCRILQNTNNEIHQKRSENKEKKLKKSPDKNKNRYSNRNNTTLLLGSKLIDVV